MMFTSGLAADILFYSPVAWVLYANDPHPAEMGSIQGLGEHIPALSLGSDPVELLCRARRCLWLHASCAAAINRNTPKPAAQSSENTQTGLPEP